MTRTLLLALCCMTGLAAACPLSGGGGGSGGGGYAGGWTTPPAPTWTKHSEVGSRVRVYAFTDEHGQLPACWSRDIGALSKRVPHIRVTPEGSDDLAERYGVTERPAVVVADRHGNPLSRYQGRIPAKRLRQAVERAPRLSAHLAAAATERFQELEERYRDHGADDDLVADLVVLGRVRGHAAGAAARELLQRITDGYRSELAAITQDSDAEARERRRALRRLAREARGTEVAAEAAEALDRL